jgi:RNA polymerase sigma factor (sigma-70 family)
MDTKSHQFEALLASHERVLHNIVRLYCFHPEDRRDLAQEIRVQLWRAFPGYDPRRSFSTWLYRIALNIAISSVRRNSSRKRLHVPLDEAIIATQTAKKIDDPRVAFLEQFLVKLDELNRALLLLHLDGHSYSEISEVLGISETNVATKLSRLKQQIRKENENGTR